MGKQPPTKLPAGSYVIGDPCQILSDEDYGIFLRNVDAKKFEIRGSELAAIPVGIDGGYDFERNGDFRPCAIGVDSGNVAAVPTSLVRENPGGMVVKTEFEKPFSCWRFARWACFGAVRVCHS